MRFEYSEVHMGVPVRIQGYAENEAAATKACRAAFDKFAALEAIMSDYKADSELMRLVAKSGADVTVSEDLFRVLERSQALAKETDGAFDITIGPLVQIWRQARRTNKLPEEGLRKFALTKVGHKNLILNKERQTATLTQTGMRLDLGGIAKGYAVDEAMVELKARGISSALVEAGGDMAASEPPPGKEGWTVAIRASDGPPVMLKNQALSTSGDTEQFVEIGGKRYSHIVDPKTGLGLTTRLQVSVLGPDAFTTDGLATAISVMGRDKASPLLQKYGCKARYVFPKD